MPDYAFQHLQALRSEDAEALVRIGGGIGEPCVEFVGEGTGAVASAGELGCGC